MKSWKRPGAFWESLAVAGVTEVKRGCGGRVYVPPPLSYFWEGNLRINLEHKGRSEHTKRAIAYRDKHASAC